MTIGENYLASAIAEFLRYKSLGERAMAQLHPQQLLEVANEDSNSIATIVKHMHGNMMSRWTDFLTSDGEKSWRKRDEEFDNDVISKESLMTLWEEGWQQVFAAMKALRDNQLLQTVFIRQEPLTVTDAINRQLAHYAYHVGQIVFAAKALKTGEWTSLSIPKKKK